MVAASATTVMTPPPCSNRYSKQFSFFNLRAYLFKQVFYQLIHPIANVKFLILPERIISPSWYWRKEIKKKQEKMYYKRNKEKGKKEKRKKLNCKLIRVCQKNVNSGFLSMKKSNGSRYTVYEEVMSIVFHCWHKGKIVVTINREQEGLR